MGIGTTLILVFLLYSKEIFTMLYFLIDGHLLFDRSPRVHFCILRHRTLMLPLVHQIHLALNIIFCMLKRHVFCSTQIFILFNACLLVFTDHLFKVIYMLALGYDHGV